MGCERQLEKAERRLRPYSPAHRRVDVDDLLAQVRAAQERIAALPRVTIRRIDADPPGRSGANTARR